MPTFTIQVPGDPRTFTVEGPEGSTEEDAMVQVRKQMIADRPKESRMQDFAEGVGLSALETGYGIKDLVGLGTPQDAATLEDWRQDAGQSGWGTAGKIGGDIAQFMVPGTIAMKGVSTAAKASKLAKALQATRGTRAATRAVSDIGGAALVGGIKSPDIGETRTSNMAGEVAGAATGEMLGYGLGKAIRGINKTDAAQRLLDAGVPLTPGEASSGKLIQGMEAVGEVTPLVAHGVKRAREASERGLESLALRSATAPGKAVTTNGVEAIQQLKKGFADAYGDAWQGATSLSTPARVGFVNKMSALGSSATKSQRRALSTIASDFKELTKNITPEKMRTLDNDLRKRISAAKKDYDFQEGLTTLRNQLREGAPPEVIEKLSAIDKKYGSYLVVRAAAKDALADGGQFSGKHLIRAVKRIGKDQAGEGSAPLQQIAMDAGQTTERSLGGQPLEWFRRVAGITATPLPMQAMGRVALGRTKPQMVAQKATDMVPELLRRPGAYGAATDVDERDFWKVWK